MNTRLKALSDWVAEVADLTQAEEIHWCDGSPEEYERFIGEMLESGDLVELNQTNYPGCYLHRSDPNDVARVEHLTYVCTSEQNDAGPNNHWMAPADAKTMMRGFYEGCMKGRTLYVVPYCMGPLGSPYARYGVEITDSTYVAASMYLMTRMGAPVLRGPAKPMVVYRLG